MDQSGCNEEEELVQTLFPTLEMSRIPCLLSNLKKYAIIVLALDNILLRNARE